MHNIVESVIIIFSEKICENDKLWFLTVGLIIGCMQSNVNAGLSLHRGAYMVDHLMTLKESLSIWVVLPLWESIFVLKWHNKIDTAFEKI